MDKKFRLALLMDFYAPLLTDKQREVLSLHIQEDLSYGEIALEKGISRQAAADAAKVAGEQLEEFEQKLNMLSLHMKLTQELDVLEIALDQTDLALAREQTKALRRLIDEEE